jgi:hypothetical protein
VAGRYHRQLAAGLTRPTGDYPAGLHGSRVRSTHYTGEVGAHSHDSAVVKGGGSADVKRTGTPAPRIRREPSSRGRFDGFLWPVVPIRPAARFARPARPAVAGRGFVPG